MATHRLRDDQGVPEGRAGDRAVDQDRGQDLPDPAARGDGPLTSRPDSPRPVLVVDLGAQYAQLIARRVREAHVYSEIVPHDLTADELAAPASGRDHPSRRPGLGVRAGRAAGRPGLFDAGRAGAGHLLRAPADGPGARRRGRRHRVSASTAAPRCTVDGGSAAAGPPGERHRVDEPRRRRHRGARGFRVTARTDAIPVAAMEDPGAGCTPCSSTPRSRTPRTART